MFKVKRLAAGTVFATALSIERRLLDMQRKLSEIAEIPKILSSTLATVTQTFDKLVIIPATKEVQRKYSYDEDAIDYELSATSNAGDDMEESIGRVANDRKCSNGMAVYRRELAEFMRNKMKLKDGTPESDYASDGDEKEDYEAGDDSDSESESAGDEYDSDNLEERESVTKSNASDKPVKRGDDDDDDDDNSSLNSDDYDYVVNYTLALNGGKQESNYDYRDDGEGDDDDDDDFLTTTYTWNMRNVPKLQINDEITDDKSTEAENGADLKEEQEKKQELLKEKKEEKVCFKLDNKERGWPWADREKIIYKQSTCHLVPRKPLGLVEQRIQLLSKQNLMHNLKTLDKTPATTK